MFKVNSEGSSTADNVNIVWLLYAVPTKVLAQNVHQIKKFKFVTL